MMLLPSLLDRKVWRRYTYIILNSLCIRLYFLGGWEMFLIWSWQEHNFSDFVFGEVSYIIFRTLYYPEMTQEWFAVSHMDILYTKYTYFEMSVPQDVEILNSRCISLDLGWIKNACATKAVADIYKITWWYSPPSRMDFIMISVKGFFIDIFIKHSLDPIIDCIHQWHSPQKLWSYASSNNNTSWSTLLASCWAKSLKS